MSTNKHPDDSPGTSDRGQLTASVSPYMPRIEPQPDYVPPPLPGSYAGNAITEAADAQFQALREFSADAHGVDRSVVANKKR